MMLFCFYVQAEEKLFIIPPDSIGPDEVSKSNITEIYNTFIEEAEESSVFAISSSGIDKVKEVSKSDMQQIVGECQSALDSLDIAEFSEYKNIEKDLDSAWFKLNKILPLVERDFVSRVFAR